MSKSISQFEIGDVQHSGECREENGFRRFEPAIFIERGAENTRNDEPKISSRQQAPSTPNPETSNHSPPAARRRRRLHVPEERSPDHEAGNRKKQLDTDRKHGAE